MGIYRDFTTFFILFYLKYLIEFHSYLPVTPALPVTSASCPLPLDYSNFIGLFSIGHVPHFYHSRGYHKVMMVVSQMGAVVKVVVMVAGAGNIDIKYLAAPTPGKVDT